MSSTPAVETRPPTTSTARANSSWPVANTVAADRRWRRRGATFRLLATSATRITTANSNPVRAARRRALATTTRTPPSRSRASIPRTSSVWTSSIAMGPASTTPTATACATRLSLPVAPTPWRATSMQRLPSTTAAASTRAAVDAPSRGPATTMPQPSSTTAAVSMRPARAVPMLSRATTRLQRPSSMARASMPSRSTIVLATASKTPMETASATRLTSRSSAVSMRRRATSIRWRPTTMAPVISVPASSPRRMSPAMGWRWRCTPRMACRASRPTASMRR